LKLGKKRQGKAKKKRVGITRVVIVYYQAMLSLRRAKKKEARSPTRAVIYMGVNVQRLVIAGEWVNR